MLTKSFDTFEDEAEISMIINRLQSEGLKHLSVPDQFWSESAHKDALKNARDMGNKVLARL